jgi:hypothetical protein
MAEDAVSGSAEGAVADEREWSEGRCDDVPDTSCVISPSNRQSSVQLVGLEPRY